VQTCFGVFGKGGGGGEADVAEGVEVVGEVGCEVVEGFRDGAGRGDVGDGRRVGLPGVTGDVEYCHIVSA
jgi:hypothetical protein